MKYLAITILAALLTGCATTFHLEDYEQWRTKHDPINLHDGASAE